MDETSSTDRSEAGAGSVATLLRVGGSAGVARSENSTDRMRALRVRGAMKAVPSGIDATASLLEAEDRMDAAGVNWLPVLDRGRLVGLITRLDIRQALAARSGARTTSK